MNPPPCPRCDTSDHVTYINHPSAGEWECTACAQLFTGSGREYMAMAEERERHRARLDNPQPPLPPMRYRRARPTRAGEPEEAPH